MDPGVLRWRLLVLAENIWNPGTHARVISRRVGRSPSGRPLFDAT